MVRFHARNLLPIRIAAGALASLFLASCINFTSSKPYPIDWAPLEQSHARDSCPNIAGVYFDSGDYVATASGRPCGILQGPLACKSLTYALLYGANLFTSKRVWPTQVQIKQPTTDVVEIHDITNPDEQKQILSLSNGDFTCDSDGLRLSDKSTALVLLISNFVKNETRTFNRASDGSLIMNTKWRTTGNHTVIPLNLKEEGWVRWKRFDFIESSSKPLPPNPDYLECVKSGVEKCDEYVSCFSGGKRQWTNRSKCD